MIRMNILKQLIFAEMGKIAGPKIMMKQVWRFDVVFRIYESELPVQAQPLATAPPTSQQFYNYLGQDALNEMPA